jgi:chromate transporter
MILWQLFAVFFKVGLFAIGGAYSFLPLVQKDVVESHGWLSKSEFLEVTGIVEIFPGAISIKFATYTGYKLAGIPGAVVANVANLLPPVLFMTVATLIYARYGGAPAVRSAMETVRWAVFAMIIAVALKLIDTRHPLEWKYVPVIVISFLLLTMTRVHPALVLVAAALCGGFIR